MSLTRAESHYYVRKLYQFLKGGHHIAFKKMRIDRGRIWLDEECREVQLDHRSEILSTLIHEHLHHQHPTWCESDILKMESLVVNSLTDRQVRNIIKRFADAL